MEMRVEYQKVN